MDMRENTRLLALGAVMDILEDGRFSGNVLSSLLSEHQSMDKKERSFMARLVQGTVERCISLDYLLNHYSKVKTKKMKPAIRNILRISVYQIVYMESIPDSAACNEAVRLAEKRGFHGLKGFVNGVLRTVSREKDRLPWPGKEKDVLYFSVYYSVPEWIVEKFLGQFGADTAKDMLASQYQERQTVIRRSLLVSKDNFLREIKKEEAVILPGLYLPYAYRLSGYDYLEGMESFCKGIFTVQDESSMLAVEAAGIFGLLESNPDRKDFLVLDACGAPGGKSILAAEMLKRRGRVISRDLTEKKTTRIMENMERLHISNVDVQCQDALVLDETLLQRADIVFADLPCSGLGIMGHKNDIKYHTSKHAVEELAALQKQILSVLWHYVKPDGVLIFSTCTVTAEENADNRQWVIENTSLVPDSLVPFLPEKLAGRVSAAEGWLQLLQGKDGTDGFYIARFKNTGTFLEKKEV